MAKRLANRTILITGASRGIGAAVAKACAREGAHVILVARTVGGLEDVDDAVRGMGGEATLVPLDLKDYEGIDRLGAAVAERWGRLDGLIANAGVLGRLGPLAHIDPEDWQNVLDINLSANWRLIRAFDPLLRQSDAGRAVFVSSGVGTHPRAYWAAYSVSKAALEALATIYAGEVEKTDIRVNILNPGATRTRMRATAMPGEDPETLPPAEDVAECFLDLVDPACPFHGEILDYADWRDTGRFHAA